MSNLIERVPYFDFHAGIAAERAELQRAFDEVLDSGWLIMGTQLAAFEAEFAAYCDATHAIGVGTGLDAIVLALRALGIGRGDEVIVSAHTYIATWLAVDLVGATIVPVDASIEHGLLDLDQVRAAITERTRCILPVHLYGHAEQSVELREIADKHDLVIVEDAAQAHGTKIGDKRIGSFADITAFSFYPSKNLGALGDGGAVTTSSDAHDAQLRMLRNYGSKQRYVNDIVGTNSRLDELHAAFMRTRLPNLDAHNVRRAQIAARYTDAVAGSDARICQPRTGTTSAWHIAPVWLERRDELQQHLAADGIDTLIHYPIPPHQSGAFADHGFTSFPIAEQIARTTLSLPISPYMPEAQVDRVVDSLGRFLG